MPERMHKRMRLMPPVAGVVRRVGGVAMRHATGTPGHVAAIGPRLVTTGCVDTEDVRAARMRQGVSLYELSYRTHLMVSAIWKA